MPEGLIPASEISPRVTRWFWHNRIPFGAITLLEGGPGQAKSSVTYDLPPAPAPASRCRAARSVLPRWRSHVQAEDNPETTIVPGLKAAGADLSRVYIHATADAGCRPLLLPDGMSAVVSAVRDLGAKFGWLSIRFPATCQSA